MEKKNNYFGFVRDKTDIQILILYILDRLPYGIDEWRLGDLVLLDGGFTWFEFADCLAGLVQAEQVSEEDGRFEITERGRRNVSFIGSSLPYSVRAKADRLIAPVAAAMRRDRQIETNEEQNEDGTICLSMRLSDGVGEVIALRLTVPDEKTAGAIERSFRKNAEKQYEKILSILTENT